MDASRWNDLISQCAAEAIDECGEIATVQQIALRAATLAAEAVSEALAEDQSPEFSEPQ